MTGTTRDLFGNTPAPRSTNRGSSGRRDQQFFIMLTKRLKKAQTEYNRKRGPNPAFPWSTWGQTPRSGAKWTDVEIKSLMLSISTMQQTVELLGINHLCELAWLHGRSAEGVRIKLSQLFTYKDYYSIFESDL